MPDLFAPESAVDPLHVALVKQWAEALLMNGPGCTFLVSEMPCSEPGCPPICSVIAILWPSGETKTHKLPKRIADLSREDVMGISIAEQWSDRCC